MSLFHRRKKSEPEAASENPSPTGLAEFAAAHGWEPRGERPFDGHLEDAVHEIARVMYGAPRNIIANEDLRVSETYFRDSFRTVVDGHGVIVSNGWTNIQTEVRYSPEHWRGVAVCAVELPTMLLVAGIDARQFAAAQRTRETPTGNPEFDERFIVSAAPGGTAEVLTPEVQQLIMARDDWCFPIERYLFGCVSKGPFGSVDDVNERIREILAIVAAIPASVMPQQVDYSQDDLIARIGKLQSMDEAFALLNTLTPEERERLAQSDSPLAAFADVRTPQEAMARFKSLDQPTKMQLFGMFMRVKDTR